MHIIIAASAGYADVVKQLLSHGAQLEVTVCDGKSALDLASEAKSENVILAL